MENHSAFKKKESLSIATQGNTYAKWNKQT
jgi:hypothetical protein